MGFRYSREFSIKSAHELSVDTDLKSISDGENNLNSLLHGTVFDEEERCNKPSTSQ